MLTTHENALRLLATLERRNGIVNKVDVDGFNLSVDNDIESMKNFVAMHYVLSEREDSSYWKYIVNEVAPAKEEELYDMIVRSPRLYQEFTFASNGPGTWGALDGLLYIAAGMGHTPLGKTECMYRLRDGRHKLRDNLESTYNEHLKYEKKLLEKLPTMKSTFEFLRDNVYKSV